MRIVEYFINLDERGEFYADIRLENGTTIFEIKGTDIFEAGFMRHKTDLVCLKEYLVGLSILNSNDEIVLAN